MTTALPEVVTVTTTPTRLDPVADRAQRGFSVGVGATAIYIANSNDVAASGANRGRLVAAGSEIRERLTGDEQLWAVTASGTSDCEVMEGDNIEIVPPASSGGTSNPNGQATMANSAPVTIANNQSAVPTDLTKVAGATVAQGHGTAATAVRVELPTDGTGVVVPDGSVASGATDSGKPVKIGGVYRSSAPTLTDGQRGDAQLDANANAKTVEQYAPVYEDNAVGVAVVEHRFTAQAISTATTTTVKSGAGLLKNIIVTGGTAGTIIIYDNTAASGTIIASFDSTNAMAAYAFDAKFTTGLTIITSAATKLTVNYR